MIMKQSMDTGYQLLAEEPYVSPPIPLAIDEELHRLVLRSLRSGIEYEHVHHSENKLYMIDRLNYLLRELVVSHRAITSIITTTSKDCSIKSSSPQYNERMMIDVNAESRYATLLDEAILHIHKW